MPSILSKSFGRSATTRLLCFASLAAAILGCGPSGPAYWPISGKVTFRGTPVTTAKIRFCNSQLGIDIVESLQPDGRYVVVTGERNGLPEGQYRVAVMPKLDFSRMKTEPNGRPIPSTMPTFEERHPPNIPDKYHTPATSGLTATVKPKANVFDVDMR